MTQTKMCLRQVSNPDDHMALIHQANTFLLRTVVKTDRLIESTYPRLPYGEADDRCGCRLADDKQEE